MWINKNGAAAPKKEPPKPKAAPAERELHVPHNVEIEISGLLIQHGRLAMRMGRQLMHFVGITRNNDGSVDYKVRTRMHTGTGLERNFESHVRIHRDERLQLLR